VADNRDDCGENQSTHNAESTSRLGASKSNVPGPELLVPGSGLALFALFQQFGSDIGPTAGPTALFD
jgi:hypothetical protein